MNQQERKLLNGKNSKNNKLADLLELDQKLVYIIGTGNNVYSIKIDTHEDNQIMRKMLSSTGFTHCGTILLRDGNKRLAFEKTLK